MISCVFQVVKLVNKKQIEIPIGFSSLGETLAINSSRFCS